MPFLIDRKVAPLVLGLLAPVACGSESARVDDESAGDRQSSRESVEIDWPCEKEGFPCTWEEVDAGVAERSRSLGEEALDRFERGGASGVVAWLAAQPDVAEADEEDATLVWFRLQGGRPVYVQGPLPPSFVERLTAPLDETSRAAEAELLLGSTGHGIISGWEALKTLAPAPHTASPLPGVTGRDRTGDRKVNQRDQRKALVLEPFNWEFCYEALEPVLRMKLVAGLRYKDGESRPSHEQIADQYLRENSATLQRICQGEDAVGDLRVPNERAAQTPGTGAMVDDLAFTSEGEKVKKILEAMPAYADHVTLLVDDEVDFGALQNWADYDVIHINAHGTRRTIGLGANIAWPGRGKLRGGAARRRGLDPVVFKAGRHGPRKWTWFADHRFFRGIYPRGLDRTLIYMSSCRALGDPRQATPALASQVLGRESMFVGWGGSIPGSVAQQTAEAFYQLLAVGWSGEEAIRRIPVLEGGDYDDPIFTEDRTRGCENAAIGPEDLALAFDITMDELAGMGGVEGWCRKTAEESKEFHAGEVFGSRGSDMRIREIVRLLHPRLPSDDFNLADTGLDQAQVRDGDDLSRLLVGEAGDGEPDLLRVTVEVEAIKPEQADATKVHLELDGQQIGEPRSVAEGAPTGLTESEGRVDASTHRIDFENVPVGKDLEPGKEYELEAVVSLPEKGESRYAARLTTEVCRSKMQGDLEGSLGGGNARAFERGDVGNFAKLFLEREAGAILPARTSALQIHAKTRRDYVFSLSIPIDRPLEAGSRFLIDDPAVEVTKIGGGLNVRGAGYGGRRDLSLGWHVGTVRVSIDQVNWREGIPDRTGKRGWACGEIDADLVGWGEPPPGTMTPLKVPHTFKARFWAEITRPATAP